MAFPSEAARASAISSRLHYQTASPGISAPVQERQQEVIEYLQRRRPSRNASVRRLWKTPGALSDRRLRRFGDRVTRETASGVGNQRNSMAMSSREVFEDTQPLQSPVLPSITAPPPAPASRVASITLYSLARCAVRSTYIGRCKAVNTAWAAWQCAAVASGWP